MHSKKVGYRQNVGRYRQTEGVIDYVEYLGSGSTSLLEKETERVLWQMLLLFMLFQDSISVSLSLSLSLFISNYLPVYFINQYLSLFLNRHVEQFFAFLRITKPKNQMCLGTRKQKLLNVLAKMFNQKLNIFAEHLRKKKKTKTQWGNAGLQYNSVRLQYRHNKSGIMCETLEIFRPCFKNTEKFQFQLFCMLADQKPRPNNLIQTVLDVRKDS